MELEWQAFQAGLKDAILRRDESQGHFTKGKAANVP